MTKTRWIVAGGMGLTGLVLGHDTLPAFFHLPSLLITLGGTLIVTCFTYSWQTLKEVWIAVHTVLTTRLISPREQLLTLAQLAHLNHLGGLRALESREEGLCDPVLRRGVSLIVDMCREDEIRAGIEQEFYLVANRYETARQVLLTMGKLLPAFGMVGTLIGLVLLLHHAADPDPHTLAPSLAVAVLTTLYGAVLSNALILPLAAKFQMFIRDRELLMRLALEGIVLVARHESPALIQKRLSAMLTSERIDTDDRHATPAARQRPALSYR